MRIHPASWDVPLVSVVATHYRKMSKKLHKSNATYFFSGDSGHSRDIISPVYVIVITPAMAIKSISVLVLQSLF